MGVCIIMFISHQFYERIRNDFFNTKQDDIITARHRQLYTRSRSGHRGCSVSGNQKKYVRYLHDVSRTVNKRRIVISDDTTSYIPIYANKYIRTLYTRVRTRVLDSRRNTKGDPCK